MFLFLRKNWSLQLLLTEIFIWWKQVKPISPAPSNDNNNWKQVQNLGKVTDFKEEEMKREEELKREEALLEDEMKEEEEDDEDLDLENDDR